MLTDNQLIEWRFDEGGGKVVYNHAPGAPAVAWKNLLGLGAEQCFNDYWNPVSATFTEYFAANPNGDLTATRLQFSGGSFQYAQKVFNTGEFPTGTYTFSFYAKSNTGTNQVIGAQFWGGAGTGDITVTTAWQRFSFTGNFNSNNFITFNTGTGNPAADVLIWGAQLEAGSTATSYQNQSYDLVLGGANNSVTQQPTWNRQGIFCPGGAQRNGRAINNTIPHLTQCAMYCAFKRVGNVKSPGYVPLLTGDAFHPTIGIVGEQADVYDVFPAFFFGNGTGVTANDYCIDDGQLHVMAGSYDGTTLTIYMDGVLFGSINSPGLSAQDVKALFLSWRTGTESFAGLMCYFSLYSVGHTISQIVANTVAIAAYLATRGINVGLTNPLLIAEGDSITQLPHFGGYVYLTVKKLNALGYPIQARNLAVAGCSLNDMIARAAGVDAMFDPARGMNILSVLIGANGGSGDASYVADLKAYCLARRAVGFIIILVTPLPQNVGGDEATWNTWRHGVITAIQADPSFYDVLCDVGSDPVIGADNAPDNSALFMVDKIHPTWSTGTGTAGQDYLYNAFLPALSSLLVPAAANALTAQQVRVELDANSTKLSAINAKTTNLPADPASNTNVDTRLASNAYVAPPSAASIAVAVWNALTSGLTTANSVGAYLLNRLGLVGSGAIVAVSPVDIKGNVKITHGDDYYAADNRALPWSSTTWPNLTGATISFQVVGEVGDVLRVGGSVVTAGTGTQEVQVELSKANTSLLVKPSYPFKVVATLADGHVVTLVNRSTLTVCFP